MIHILDRIHFLFGGQIMSGVCANMRGVVIWSERVFVSYDSYEAVRKRMFAEAICQNSKIWVECTELSGFAALKFLLQTSSYSLMH